jgi:hypothetical protein
MFEEARTNIEKTTRRGMALYFGTINLAGETVTNPTKILRGIERRGERVLKQIENNNKQIRRNVTLLQKRTSETANSVRSTAKTSAGLATNVANDVEAAAAGRSARKRSTGRRRTTARSRVAAAGRTGTVSTSSSRATSTRSSSTTRNGSRSKAAVAKQRSQAALKAARTRALNGRVAETKKAAAVAKARTNSAANEKGTLEKAQERVQQGFQQVGHQLENVGERIERTAEQVAS